MRFQKKLVGQSSLGYAQPCSHPSNTAKQCWHADIERRSLVWKILSGVRLSRREEALPAKLSGLNLATPDARHRRPLKIFLYNRNVRSKARAKRQMSFRKCSKSLLIRS